MVNCGSLLRCALAVAVLVVVVDSQKIGEKLATCCEQVTTKEITEPILDYLIQQINPPCVKAVIFQTESGLYCVYPKAAWVLPKIRELRRARALSTTGTSSTPVLSTSPSSSSSSSSPPSSLLSIITSAASTSQ